MSDQLAGVVERQYLIISLIAIVGGLLIVDVMGSPADAVGGGIFAVCAASSIIQFWRERWS